MSDEIAVADVKPVEAAPAAQMVKQTVNQVQEKPQEEESIKDINWKAFKKARDEERKQAEEVAKQAKKSQEEAAALKAALDAVLNKPSNHSDRHNDHQNDRIIEEEDEEKRIERKVNELLSKKEAEYEKKRQEKDLEALPVRLNADFKDFEKVCSTENLDYLDYHYPEITRAFAHMPQGYERWACIYKAAKKFVPNSTTSDKEAAKADRNFQKPQSGARPGMTNNGESAPAHILSDKKKAENYARMMRTMNKLDP